MSEPQFRTPPIPLISLLRWLIRNAKEPARPEGQTGDSGTAASSKGPSVNVLGNLDGQINQPDGNDEPDN